MSIKIAHSSGRPTNLENFLVQWGVDIASWFEEWQQSNNRIATGKSVGGYIVDLTNKNEVTIDNEADYMPYPLTGRNAGKFPPIQAIEDWIIAKGIPLQDISLSSLAFLIARKISSFGTDQPRLKMQNLDAVINAKSVKWINRISDQLAIDASDLMVNELTKNGTFKEK